MRERSLESPSMQTYSRPGEAPLRFLAGPGEMAERIRNFGWAATPLGPPQAWPTSLRTTVAMMLRTRHPVFIFWGPDLLCLYNDAYSRSLGPEKHPGILGLPGRQAFSELWHIIGPDIDQVMAGGPASWHENALVPSYRHGKLDDVYWTYSYGGIDDEDCTSGVGGVLVLCNETTAQVLESQRVKSDLARLAALFEQAPVFMAALSGPEHVFRFVSPAYRQLIGGRDVVGRSVREALPEVVGQGYLRRLDEVWQSATPYRAEAAKVRLAQGTNGELDERWLDFVYQPSFDAAGLITGILAIGVDVTERQRTAQALAFREEQLRLATEAGEVGFWDVDPASDALYWPPSLRRMFGIFSDRPVSMQHDFREGLHPSDRDATLEAFAAATDPRQRALYDVEYRTIGREDGVVRWVAARGRASFDTQGRCVRVLGTALDITARRQGEERLRELNDTLTRRLDEYLAERKLLADVVEGTDALIQVVDRRFTILASNRGNVDEFERIYGVRPKVGDNLLDLIAHIPGAGPEAHRVWSRVLAGESFVEEGQFGDPALSRRWYELHFQPLYAASGELVAAFQFGYDITARREAERRLAEAEAVLQQAQRMEAIGLLTGGVAHDFNNVLQALNAKFELIRRRADSAGHVRAWAEDGIALTRKAARVTAQLLAFSRPQAAGDQTVAVDALLHNMHDLLRTTLGPHVVLRVDSAPAWVLADSTQLEMALLNLAVNARDAMPGGGTATLTVNVGHETVEIAFSDTGTGMSSALIAKAFTPFFTTKEFGKGSGLGLAQVYAMAQRVGGDVRIESDGHSGTSVHITLRRVAPPQTGETAPAGGPLQSVAVARILVVDDDAAVRAPLVELLRELGYRVIEAGGGEEALALMAQAQPDILLSDYAMPGMNGVALANLARAARPGLQVIFMSGYAAADEIIDAIGNRGLLLRKPFDMDAVQRAIDQAMLRRGDMD
jgi:PAS domain S-box-containing protein